MDTDIEVLDLTLAKPISLEAMTAIVTCISNQDNNVVIFMAE